MMRKIEVDQDVYSALQREAQPFVDTPNSVLRRLLGLDARSSAGVVDMKPTREEFHLVANGVSARAIRIGDRGLRMLAAESVLNVLPSLSASNRELRHRLLDEGVFASLGEGRGYRLTRPFDFSSPSAASSVLLGRESNGRLDWKDESGEPLGER